MNIDLHSAVALLALGGLAVALPVWDFFEARRLRRACTTNDRLRYYWAILGAHLLFGVASFYYLGLRGVLNANGAIQDAGFFTGTSWQRIMLVGVSNLFLLVAALPLLMSLRKKRFRAAYVRAVNKTACRFIFPTNGRERAWFAVLCLSAGAFEEMIFRSYLVAYFHSGLLHLPVWPALLLSSIVFGFNHLYQGPAGIAKTAIAGFAFGVICLTSGSLLLAMVLHALVDLQALYLYRPDIAALTAEPVAA